MSNLEVAIQDDLMKDPSKNQFNILNPEVYQRFMKGLSKNQNLFDLMRKGLQLKYDITRGLQFNELEELIQSEHRKDVQFMLKAVKKLTDGQSTWLATTSVDSMKHDTMLIFGKIVNGKYDILNIQATQIKTLDEQKLIVCGIGALCASLLVGSIATPIAGVIAGGSMLAASGIKTFYDYRKVLPIRSMNIFLKNFLIRVFLILRYTLKSNTLRRY